MLRFSALLAFGPLSRQVVDRCHAFGLKVSQADRVVFKNADQQALKNKVHGVAMPKFDVSLFAHSAFPSCVGSISHDSRTGSAVNRAPGEVMA